MKFIPLLQWTIVFLGMLFLVTQIILPGFRNRPMFPLLRKRVREVEGRLAGAHEDVDVQAKEKVIDQLSTVPPAPNKKRRS